MCSIENHYRDQPTVNDDTSSVSARPLLSNWKEVVLVSLGITLNFIDSWLKSLKANYLHQRKNCEEMCELFNKLSVIIPWPEPDYYKKKTPVVYRYSGRMAYQ